MAELANAIAEVFAAVLRSFGYVGRPRRRAAIREDLVLLRELIDFPGGEFGVGTAPHQWLVAHIYQQVGEFVGLDFSMEKRKANLSSVYLIGCLAAALGWVSYYLLSHDYGWWAAFPVAWGSLFAVSAVGMFFEKEPIVNEGNLTESEDEIPAGSPALEDIQDLADGEEELD